MGGSWSTIDSDWRRFPCLEWPGNIDDHGYGYHYERPNGKRRKVMAHRAIYEATVGPIPSGLFIDHLCRNRACSQPWHLEPVTNAENIRRGEVGKLASARARAQTHCKYGHPLSGDNITIRIKDGYRTRVCIACRNRNNRARRKTNVG